MKTKFIILIITLINLISIKNISAQEYKMNCKMTLSEIMEQQDIDKDTREYKKAIVIAEVLLSEINMFYDELNGTGIGEATDKSKDAVESVIKSASIINMDLSMFDDDIKFIRSIPRNQPRQQKCK